MSKQQQLKIIGIEEIQQALAELEKGVSDRALQDIHRAALRIPKKALKTAAPSRSRRLKQTNATAIKPNRRSKDKTAVQLGFRKRAFTARFFEKGTKNRKTRKGYRRGVFNKRPFVERAYLSTYKQVIDFVQANALKIMKRSLARYSNRLSKKLNNT